MLGSSITQALALNGCGLFVLLLLFPVRMQPEDPWQDVHGSSHQNNEPNIPLYLIGYQAYSTRKQTKTHSLDGREQGRKGSSGSVNQKRSGTGAEISSTIILKLKVWTTGFACYLSVDT